MAAPERDIAGYKGARLIGRGGFGAVYQATDAAHGRDVAIKVLPGRLGEAERRRFDRERQTMGRLGAHPYIIPVYDSGYTDGGEGYIVMELASGGSLRERLESGPIPWDEATKIMAAVAEASQAAHDNGVLHRDIKPDNVLIDQFGNPKLSDFGIAAVATNATATTSTTATLAHAAPELLQGHPSTPSIDIYAIGSTLHALITGRPPFLRPEDESVTPLITRALTEPPPELQPYGVPDAVAQVVARALAKAPTDRQASAQQLADELRAAAVGQPPPSAARADTSTAAATQIASYPPPMPTDQATGHVYPSSPTTPDFDPTGQPAAYNQGFNTGGGGYQPTGQPHGYAHSGPVPGVGHTPNPLHSSGGQVGAPYGTSPSWDPSQGARPTKSGLSGGRIGLIVLAALLLLGGAGAVALAAADNGDGSTTSTIESSGSGTGGDTASTQATDPTTASTSATTTPTTGSPTLSAPSTLATDGPTVRVDCPTEVPLNVKIFCSIFTTNATSGEWHLPAFLVAPEPIEVVPGEYEIFVEPTNPEAVGRTFTITASAEDESGASAETTHSFTVVDVFVEINCPERISLDSSIVCDIISTNATEGEWDIPGFGGADLAVVPGSNPIFIEPKDPGGVGQNYTITATVRDASGGSYTATKSFIITPAGS